MARFLLQENQNGQERERSCGAISTVNKYGFALIGSLTAITSARLYVGLGGSLNFSILGHELHHFYYGITLLIIAAILKIKSKVPESLIFFIIGLGLGYLCDEFDLLLSIGRPYTLELYDNPVNVAMDLILVLILFRLSRSHNYVHGLLYGAERVL